MVRARDARRGLLSRRRAALRRFPGLTMPDDAALARLAANLGVPSVEQHLYELPTVARKRLSWLWPLSGAMPWIMLDEPTVGQDAATRMALATTVGRLAALGFGVVFITHNDASRRPSSTSGCGSGHECGA